MRNIRDKFTKYIMVAKRIKKQSLKTSGYHRKCDLALSWGLAISKAASYAQTFDEAMKAYDLAPAIEIWQVSALVKAATFVNSKIRIEAVELQVRIESLQDQFNLAGGEKILNEKKAELALSQ